MTSNNRRGAGSSKVLVLQRASGRDARAWAVAHELLEEVDTCAADLSLRVPDVRPALRDPLREGWLEVWQLGDSWPEDLSRGAQLHEDLERRVDLRIPSEERRTCGHLP